MRIAVCDDEYVAVEEIEKLLKEYSSKNGIHFDYDLFDNYSALEPVAEKYDIFLLDYLMPGINGMDFAGKIREKCGSEKVIIFITQYDEIVHDAFTVQTHRFLLKPIVKTKFYEALDSAFSNIANNDRRLIIRYDGNTTSVKLDEIYYVEIRYKELYIYTKNEQILCHRSIKSIEQEIEHGCFFRVHRSYLVNMKKIRSFNNSKIEFINGETIPVSSRNYAAFCKAYLKMK